MNLNRRLRSRSETRAIGAAADAQHQQHFKGAHQQQQQQQYQQTHEQRQQCVNARNGSRRKTSAELISEAKFLLNGTQNNNNNNTNGTGADVGYGVGGLAGLRLVNTRRPVTPREAGRALYGNVKLAGRPPSSFSMRYLQHENQRVPAKAPTILAPICSTEQLDALNASTTTTTTKRHRGRRSHSLGSTVEFCKAFGVNGNGGVFHSFDGDTNYNKNTNNGRNIMAMPRKLPALEINGLPLNVQGKTNVNAHEINNNNNSSASNTSQMNDNGSDALNLLSTRRLLIHNCDVLAQSSTQKLIELLKEHAGLKDCTDETANHVHAILVELYGRVRKQEKRCKRAYIVGGLYGLVEATSPKILLAVAKVVLALRVTGSNLTGACKLIFKVARSEHNDNLFHDNDLLELLIEGLGRASPMDDPEACIYGYGAIRFLTSSSAQERDALTTTTTAITGGGGAATTTTTCNTLQMLDEIRRRKPETAPAGGGGGGTSNSSLLQEREHRWQRLYKQNTLVQRMARQGAVQLMVLHLQLLNEAGAERKLTGPPLHSLYQLAAALRALADVRQTSAAAAAENGAWQSNKGGSGATATIPSTIAEMAAPPPDSLQLQLACAHLVRAAEISIGELEVQANIVRTLSVLSEDEDCCFALVSTTGRIGMLLGPCCELFQNGGTDNKPLSVLSRLGYILGNLMTKYDQARLQFFRNDVAMEFLLDTLKLCCNKPLTMRSPLGDSVLDVLVKLIRVVANMSVNIEVGSGLGGVRDLGAVLVNLLQKLNKRRQQNDSKSSQLELHELMHATLGALHNLCFYQGDDDDDTATPSDIGHDDEFAQQQQQLNSLAATQLPTDCLQRVLPQLANALYDTLRNATIQSEDNGSNEDTIKLEAERVLGNLTRNMQARQCFCRCGGMSLMLQRLEEYSNSKNTASTKDELMETRACVIGVLVNLLGDAMNRTHFMKLNGMQHLLRAFDVVLQQRDWHFAAIICKAFWNLLTDTITTTSNTSNYNNNNNNNISSPTTTTIIVANRIECATDLLDELCDQLADHLDEEQLFMQQQPHNGSNLSAHAFWEDFAVVAADLLERIQNSMDEAIEDGEDRVSLVQQHHNATDKQQYQQRQQQQQQPNRLQQHATTKTSNGNDCDNDDDDDDEADVCMENL